MTPPRRSGTLTGRLDTAVTRRVRPGAGEEVVVREPDIDLGDDAGRHDLLDALAADHRDLERLGRDLADREAGAGEVAEFLLRVSVHEMTEELVLAPSYADHEEVAELADRRADEQAALFRHLDDLRGGDEIRLHPLIDEFAAHSDREEIEVFPWLRRMLSTEQLREGWRLHRHLRDEAPVRARELAGTSPDPPSSNLVRAAAHQVLAAHAPVTTGRAARR
jgi:hypothetical protein